MDVEQRGGLAGCGEAGQIVFVGARRAGDVIAEPAIAGRHRMDIGRRDVDVVQQCRTRLLLVTFVVIDRHVPVVTEEKVYPSPINRVRAEVFKQTDTGTPAGQHDHRATARRDGRKDCCRQPVAGGGYQGSRVGVGFDGFRHGQAFHPGAY